MMIARRRRRMRPTQSQGSSDALEFNGEEVTFDGATVTFDGG